MRTILITAFLALLSVTVSLAQPSWLYSRAIGFPAPDLDRVRPYGVTVDASGTIWVVSSGTIDTAAHNCLWKAGPNDTVFTKVKDYGSYYDNSFPYDDHIIGTIQGITSVGTDVYISTRRRKHGHNDDAPAEAAPAAADSLTERQRMRAKLDTDEGR